MPIYEFYCIDCHTIYNFLSRKVDTTTRPSCPRCGRREIERQPSLFSISKGLTEKEDESMPDVDEAKLERAFESMAGEMDNVNEDDPRQVGQIMRKLYDATGLQLGPGMDEAISRMEAGEDPDKVGEEMGDILDQENPFAMTDKKKMLTHLKKRFLRPEIDETLYEL